MRFIDGCSFRSFDLAAFQIVAFLGGFAHREGLPRQHAALRNELDEIRLVHRREGDPDRELVGLTDRLEVLDAVDIVDVRERIVLHVAVDVVLNQLHGRRRRFGEIERLRAALLRVGEAEGVALFEIVETVQEILGRVEDDAVDRLELQSGVVDVLQLDHRIAGRMFALIDRRERRLQGLPADLRGGEGMVPVADGELEAVRHDQPIEILDDGCRVLDLIAGDVAAAHVQLKVIDLREGVALGIQMLDDQQIRIVHQKHHVRKFEGSVLADLDARGNAGGHRVLGAADERFVVGVGGVLVEVDREDQAESALLVRGAAVDEDKRRSEILKDAVRKIEFHRLVDLEDAVERMILEERLGQDHLQRRRRGADERCQIMPVRRFGGELVAGDDGPAGQVGPLAGDEDVGCL